ncbi:MAG: hypothetical protein IJJ19_08810 [Erysipelotrichaceae bacterium]|nr:hypothetical protein [Erysipelotrichaceae bacterium]
MAVFCTIYYVLNYVKTIPQIMKLIRTKSSSDYSISMIVLQLISMVSWSIYIFTSPQNLVVYIGTVLDLLILIISDSLIFRYDNYSANA